MYDIELLEWWAGEDWTSFVKKNLHLSKYGIYKKYPESDKEFVEARSSLIKLVELYNRFSDPLQALEDKVYDASKDKV